MPCRSGTSARPPSPTILPRPRVRRPDPALWGVEGAIFGSSGGVDGQVATKPARGPQRPHALVLVLSTRVPRTVGNRTGSAGSRWNRSGSQSQTVPIFFYPHRTGRFHRFTGRFFLVRGNHSGAVWGNLLCTTSLRGVQHTFTYYSSMHTILRGFRVAVDQRDMSMDGAFRSEPQARCSTRWLQFNFVTCVMHLNVYQFGSRWFAYARLTDLQHSDATGRCELELTHATTPTPGHRIWLLIGEHVGMLTDSVAPQQLP
jgi:hypothetical protein